jgi:hypothetical protein
MPAAVMSSSYARLSQSARAFRLSLLAERAYPFALGVLAAWFVLLAELLLVLWFSRHRMTSVWEVQFAVVGLAPTLLLLSAVIAVAGAIVLGVIRRAEVLPTARYVGALVIGLGGAAVAWAISGGRLLQNPLVRGSFVVGAAALIGAVTFVIGPRLGRAMRRAPTGTAAGAALAIVVLELVNRLVLVRLYPSWHLALSVCALALAPLLPPLVAGAPRAAPPDRRRNATVAAVAVTTLIAAAGLASGAQRLAHLDNFRMLLLEQAPTLAQGVRVAAIIAPPAPIESEACAGEHCEPSAVHTPGGRSLDLRGRSVLLVSVDALRADHVSAYGYERKTTTNIDVLAAKGTVFRQAYSPTPHTSYAITSMMTGKYMRPLLLQGAAQDSETWATLLRTYGYKTGAFYPPAVFFIDTDRFLPFRDSSLGFEYRKVEFMEGEGRLRQVSEYLAANPGTDPLFVWVHLFGPHEPYEGHPQYPFGDRDVDRYDSEVAAADATLGRIVAAFRERDPDGVVIVTADHGEEFGEHGGRYHGTTVYEEQVRVPLVLSVPGLAPSVVDEPVQTIDLLPTVLAALDIPRPPRVRGRDLGPLASGKQGAGEGLAFAETEEQVLLARGQHRLLCARQVGACQLYDLTRDPHQQRDVGSADPERLRTMRSTLDDIAASHGRFEVRGLRAQGRGWPAAILRGVSGDADAAADLAGLLDDADRDVRRKAAELLFELKRPETAPALRLALTRDEDAEVRAYAALGLTRLGEGAPLAYDLQRSNELRWRRLAALALAEAGDARGENELVSWWSEASARDYERSRQLLKAFSTVRSRKAVWPLVQSLSDVRLRPFIAEALAAIGDEGARGPLTTALASERYQSAREAILRALVQLGAEAEIAQPLTRFLGVPDPVKNGVAMAKSAGILQHVGGPRERDLERLQAQSHIGAAVTVVVPPAKGERRVRAFVRARTRGTAPGEVRIALPHDGVQLERRDEKRSARVPQLDPARTMRLAVPASSEARELFAEVPTALGIRPGHSVRLVVFADREVEIEAMALVPLADELPPPAPEPWQPAQDGG